MTEVHEPQFRGVWIPADIMAMQAAGELKAADVILLAIIDSLVAPDRGCYASNDYLAKRVGIAARNIQVRIARLRELGLLKVVSFKGSKRRHLETAWSRVSRKGDENVTPGTTLASPPALRVKEKQGPAVPATDNDGGFGLVESSAGTATEFDLGVATQLLEAVRGHLGSSHPVCRRAKISSWANHLRLLRTADDTSERRIGRVMDWYATNIGGEFIPEAYAGESFRKKFYKIEAAYKRDMVATVEVGDTAAAVAARLAGLGWPKGSAEAVPAATQTTLTAYEAWVAARTAFMDKLRRDDLVEDYGGERTRLLKFGEHLSRVMASPAHFAQEWMEAVHARVREWDGWAGELSPMVFKAEAKRFRNMGRGWAKEFANDPDRWDRFCEVMKDENQEA